MTQESEIKAGSEHGKPYRNKRRRRRRRRSDRLFTLQENSQVEARRVGRAREERNGLYQGNVRDAERLKGYAVDRMDLKNVCRYKHLNSRI